MRGLIKRIFGRKILPPTDPVIMDVMEYAELISIVRAAERCVAAYETGDITKEEYALFELKEVVARYKKLY